MIPKPLDQIDQAALERLVTDQVHEGRTIEYKRAISLSNDEHRRELARDVSSFANAAGGDFIFGVEEAKDENGKNVGYPEKVVGVECPNFDGTKLRIESVIRENIDPRVQGIGFHKVDGFERGSASAAA
jgi:predicted HTH transcriptional regulator